LLLNMAVAVEAVDKVVGCDREPVVRRDGGVGAVRVPGTGNENVNVLPAVNTPTVIACAGADITNAASIKNLVFMEPSQAAGIA
jgi:hypothetical protein